METVLIFPEELCEGRLMVGGEEYHPRGGYRLVKNLRRSVVRGKLPNPFSDKVQRLSKRLAV